MPRPVSMTRALVVGPRDRREETIEALYGLGLLHLVDHHEGHEGIGIGTPLPQASSASEVLVKLRSIAAVLHVEEPSKPSAGEAAEDIREKILSLELNISEEDGARKKTQELLPDLRRRGHGPQLRRRGLGPNGAVRGDGRGPREDLGPFRRRARDGRARGGPARAPAGRHAVPALRDARQALLDPEL